MDIFRITVAHSKQYVAEALFWVYMDYKERSAHYDHSWPNVICALLERVKGMWWGHLAIAPTEAGKERLINQLRAELKEVSIFEFSQFAGNDFNNRQPAWLVELTGLDGHTEITVTPVSEDTKITRLYKLFVERLEYHAGPIDPAVSGVQYADEKSQLTERQRQVFDLVMAGAKRNEIAKNLKIQNQTVDTTIKNICVALNFSITKSAAKLRQWVLES